MAQYKKTDENGNTYYYSDPKMTILHRLRWAAVIKADGSKFWFNNGELHREDGPAIDRANGNKEWYVNGKPHRDDGPAIEYADGSRIFYKHGVLHCESGPAIIWPPLPDDIDGQPRVAWYLDGVKYSKAEFTEKLNANG